jgi:hypothetical protein
VRLSALRAGRPAFVPEDSWYSFLLEVESTQGPKCGWRDKNPTTSSGIELATFRLVAYCLNQLPCRLSRCCKYFRHVCLAVRPSICNSTRSPKEIWTKFGITELCSIIWTLVSLVKIGKQWRTIYTGLWHVEKTFRTNFVMMSGTHILGQNTSFRECCSFRGR